ncbi:hypothetical protein DFH11DRAFT_1723165 [Phellopilus nigrolimitatus]|nr:hypothetical protein DFH11DRAFT_1723165 [Phellopilus nigrolimitatus]
MTQRSSSSFQHNVVRRVEAILREHGAYGATFWEIGEHAPVAGIKSGVQALVGAAADVVVSVGGGTPSQAIRTRSSSRTSPCRQD